MRALSTRICITLAGLATTLAVAACGGGQRQDIAEPKGQFPVSVAQASFPTAQLLSQHTRMTISVRNAGHKTIPDVAVTICNVTCAYPAPTSQGTSARAFAENSNAKYLANPSRPIWVVDRPPGACKFSCQTGGQGSGVTAYSNTWALGRLAPGHTVRFDWNVTAVSPGHHVVAWEVSAGLNGRAKAVLSDGTPPHGRFAVNIAAKPQQAYVDNSGHIVNGSGQP